MTWRGDIYKQAVVKPYWLIIFTVPCLFSPSAGGTDRNR